MAARIAALGIAIVLLWSPQASASDARVKGAYVIGALILTTAGTFAAVNADPDGDYDRNGFYVGGGATLGFDVFEEDVEEALHPAADVEPSFGAIAQLGYRIHPHFSAEAEFEWLDSFNLSVAGEDLFEIETWIVTGNAKGYLLTGSIQPFALVGVGAMKVKEKDTVGAGLSHSGTDLAMRFGAGVDLYLTQRLVMDLGVDYVIPTGDVKNFDYISVGFALQYRF
jgi:opacity protein-like surface antigen